MFFYIQHLLIMFLWGYLYGALIKVVLIGKDAIEQYLRTTSNEFVHIIDISGELEGIGTCIQT